MLAAKFPLKKLNVALLAEGVDRNTKKKLEDYMEKKSPSSRRAWIEIYDGCCGGHRRFVALLAEGVDRNTSVELFSTCSSSRPPRGGRG